MSNTYFFKKHQISFLFLPSKAIIIWLLLLIFLPIDATFAQGFRTDFGKNRVQYHDFDWSYYESENFVTYFYQGGFDLGKYAVLTAEKSLEDLEGKLEYKMSRRLEMMVYHNLSDLNQTNIGLGQQESNTGGVIKIIGNKLFIHFNGDYQHFERQIREGIARVLLNNMIRGGNIQEVVQNAVLLNLPNWFINGLVSYLGEEWSTTHDERLKDMILSDKLQNFNKLYGEEGDFAGHALWHYIAQLNGDDAISNLLYLTRVNRSLESGFIFVLGNNVEKTVAAFNAYYQNIYKAEVSTAEKRNDKSLLEQTGKKEKRRNINYRELKISPNGAFITYVTDENGREKVWLKDLKTNETKVILRNGQRNPNRIKEENYPLVAWTKNSKKLAIIYDRRDKIQLMTYNLVEEEKTQHDPMNKFQQVVDVAFVKSTEKLILSAVKGGQSDLFLYAIPNTKVNRLTNDHYADLQPRHVQLYDRSGIVFVSNRPDDTLRKKVRLKDSIPNHNYNIFFYNFDSNDTLIQVTNTPLANEHLPTQYDSTHIAFISDISGQKNIYAAYFDSVFVRTDTKVFYMDSLVINPKYDLSNAQKEGLIDTIIKAQIYEVKAIDFPITNLSDNILEYDVAPKSGQITQLAYDDGKYRFYQEKTYEKPSEARKKLTKTTFRKQLENLNKSKIKLEQSKAKIKVFEKEKAKKEAEKAVLAAQNKAIQDSINATQKTTKIISDSTSNRAAQDSIIDINQYTFQSEFDFDPVAKKEKITATNSPNKSSKTKPKLPQEKPKPLFIRTKIRKHRTEFSIDNIVSQLDNSILFNQYESYNIGAAGFDNPDLNGLIKVGITDLLENYRLIGGFRLPVGLEGSEYFIEYQALRKRLDKKFLGYRKAKTETNLLGNTPVEVKRTTYQAQAALSYPFDVSTSLRLYAGLRTDEIGILATDRNTLNLPNARENWLYTKLEYVFDNTVPIETNILNGTRYKIYGEIFKPFDANINREGIDFSIKDTGFLGVLGTDFRHYTRVHKQITWANRFTSASSFGSQKMIYFLGGVDNWMLFDQTKKFDNTTPIDNQVNYGFKSLATNLRGFKQNIRNGSSFALINSELRIPVFSYFFNKPLRSEFLRNFQLVTFADVGTAWEGWSPFNRDNLYANIEVLAVDGQGETVIKVEVKHFKRPIVAGYGLGARSKLFGYFVKLDAAWGLDSGAVGNVQWYLSLGTDF